MHGQLSAYQHGQPCTWMVRDAQRTVTVRRCAKARCTPKGHPLSRLCRSSSRLYSTIEPEADSDARSVEPACEPIHALITHGRVLQRLLLQHE